MRCGSPGSQPRDPARDEHGDVGSGPQWPRVPLRAGVGRHAAARPRCEASVNVTVSTESVAGGSPGDDATRPAATRVTIHRARGKPAPAATTADSDAREELRRAAARPAPVHAIDRAILPAASPPEL